MNSKSNNQMTRSQKPLKYPRELLKYFKFLWSKLIKFRSWALFRIWNAVFRIHTQSRSLVPQWDMTSQCESQSKIKSSKCFAPTILPIKHGCLPYLFNPYLDVEQFCKFHGRKILWLYVPRSIFLAALVITQIRKHFVANFILTIYHCKTKKLGSTNDQHDIYPELAAERSPLPIQKKTNFFYGLCFKRPSIEANTIVKYDELNGSFCLWSMLANIPHTDGMGNRYSWILLFKLCNKDSNHVVSFLSTVLWLCLDHFRSITYFAGRGPMLRNLIAAWGIHHNSSIK